MISEDRKFTTSREPAPVNCTRVRIGDVGFIRRGQFHLLFSAGLPLEGRERGVDVPETFEPLNVGRLTYRERRAGYLRTDTIKEVGTGLGAGLSTTVCVSSLRALSAYSKMRRPGP